jgi:Transposase DDE domain group 1
MCVRPPVLGARHRSHVRVEDAIRTGKNTGPDHLPSVSFQINQAWCLAAGRACDLLAWLRLLCLTGDLTTAEPKTWRYRLPHAAARLVPRRQRKRKLRIPGTWPWADQPCDAEHRPDPAPRRLKRPESDRPDDRRTLAWGIGASGATARRTPRPHQPKWR